MTSELAIDDDRHPVERLAEDYVARQRRGERPTIDEYAAAHPDLAEEIRALFPAITAVEDLKDHSASWPGRIEAAAIESLGDYRIVGEIGRGGMGVVYEAEQVTLGRRVAVKVLPRLLLDDASRVSRFHREARTAASLHHTNIVPIFGTGECDGHHFYVMQLIRGLGLDRVLAALRGDTGPRRASTTDSMLGDVVSRLRHGDLADPTELDAALDVAVAMPSPRAAAAGTSSALTDPTYYRNVARIALQIAGALQYAHAHKTLHRDIKPANILLDAEGTAWITDFGLAKALEQVELTRSGDVVGTLRYMAPEQLEGRYDERSDIYALGLTLYELASLRQALPGEHRAQLLAAVGEGRPPRLAKVNPLVPRDLATLIEKACAREPRDRYASAGDLAQDLERFLDDRPIRARRVSALESAWRWCRRNRVAAALALVAVTAVLAAAAIGWVGWVATTDALAAESDRTDEARAAKDLAAANLALSLQAFDELLDEVCGPDPFVAAVSDSGDDYAVVSTTAVSTDDIALLEHVLAFYDRFAARNEDNAELAWEAAIAHRRVGDIQQLLGRLSAAESAYRHALRLLAKTVTSAAAPAQRALETAVAENQLGCVLLAQARFFDALECHDRALAALGDGDGLPVSRLEIARSHNLLGLAIDVANRPGPPGANGPNGPGRAPVRRPDMMQRSLEHHEDALAIVTDLLVESPDNPELLLTLARTRRYLARAPRRPDEPGGPRQQLTGAIRTLTDLVEEFPNAASLRFELADTLIAGAGRRMLPADRPTELPEERRSDLASAIALLDQLVAAHPAIPTYRASLAEAQHELALSDWHRHDTAATEPRLLRAVELTKDLVRAQADVPRYVHHFGLASRALSALLLELGRAADARDAAQACIDEVELIAADAEFELAFPPLFIALARSLDALGDTAGAETARQQARAAGRR